MPATNFTVRPASKNLQVCYPSAWIWNSGKVDGRKEKEFGQLERDLCCDTY